jgi:hypothetical protein
MGSQMLLFPTLNGTQLTIVAIGPLKEHFTILIEDFQGKFLNGTMTCLKQRRDLLKVKLPTNR